MTTALLLMANNAQTTLAAPITNVALTMSVSPGSGVLFPVPVANQSAFLCTLVDAATGLINEIVLVTGVAGDVFTIVRAQEGTTAKNWTTGDIAANLITAGFLADKVQGNLPVTAVALTNTNHVLTLAEYAAGFVASSGVLTADVAVVFPDGVTGKWWSKNSTTGAHIVTLKTASGTGIVAPQDGNWYEYASDGTNIITVGYQASATLPDTPQVFTGSGTYTVPTGARTLRVRMLGGGGGGGGSLGNDGGNGVNTTFAAILTAAGGVKGVNGSPGAGGLGGAPTIGSFTGTAASYNGASGDIGTYGSGVSPINKGGAGGSTPLGSGGIGAQTGAPTPAVAGTGYGAGGSGAAGSNYASGGGGAGAYIEAWITGSLAATYAVVIGTGGAAGTGGGTAGTAGIVIVEAF